MRGCLTLLIFLEPLDKENILYDRIGDFFKETFFWLLRKIQTGRKLGDLGFSPIADSF